MPDDEMLMAYADGALDPIAAKRVERAIADDPALADAVARHRALAARLANTFQPVADEPVPDRLVALARSGVARIAPTTRPRWMNIAAIAASFVIGIGIGQLRPSGDFAASGSRLIAAGALERSLNTQLADNRSGATRMLLSFRRPDGRYCRVFSQPSVNGIACHQGGAWTVRHTATPAESAADGAYRQAGSPDMAMMATAQDMMAGSPLDPAAERAARDGGW